MDEKKIFTVFGGLILVLLIAAIWRGLAGPDDTLALFEEKIAPVSAYVADLDERLAEAQARFDDQLAEIQGAMDGRLAELEDSLDALADQAASALGEDEISGLRTQIEELAMQSGELSTIVSALGPGSASAEDTETKTAMTPPEAPTVEENRGTPGLMPGQTALFDEGSVRVFVSRLDVDSDSLHASVNGERKSLRKGIGRTVAAANGHCRVTLDDVSDNGALISALCGDALPAAEGISAGETAMLDEGALRVFASRVTDGAARLSAHGEDVRLKAGERATVMVGDRSCRLILEQVDRGHAQVGAECTEAVWHSKDLTAGEAAILGDGAARVFVSSVQPDGSARIAVNGFTLRTARIGETTEMADNCDLTVSDVSRRATQVTFACYN